jgi:hypothetical protein
MTHFRVINGILLHEAVIIVKPKDIVLLKKKNANQKSCYFIFITFWRFHSFIFL